MSCRGLWRGVTPPQQMNFVGLEEEEEEEDEALMGLMKKLENVPPSPDAGFPGGVGPESPRGGGGWFPSP